MVKGNFTKFQAKLCLKVSLRHQKRRYKSTLSTSNSIQKICILEHRQLCHKSVTRINEREKRSLFTTWKLSRKLTSNQFCSFLMLKQTKYYSTQGFRAPSPCWPNGPLMAISENSSAHKWNRRTILRFLRFSWNPNFKKK